MAKGFGQYINKQQTPSRISQLKRMLSGFDDQDTIMMNIIEVFRDLELIPEPGKYYTFIYNPKTPNIVYDEYPLVAVTDIESWGFRGINFHWNKSRNYVWSGVIGQLHNVRNDEINYLRTLPYAKYRTK